MEQLLLQLAAVMAVVTKAAVLLAVLAVQAVVEITFQLAVQEQRVKEILEGLAMPPQITLVEGGEALALLV